MLDLLSFCKNVKIIIFSDRFPPDSVGGAEQSLKITISEFNNKNSILVVTFYDVIIPRFSIEDGVGILRIPRVPLANYGEDISAKVVLRILNIPLNLLDSLSIEEGNNRLNKFKEKGVIPNESLIWDFTDSPNFYATYILFGLMKYIRPRIFHSENYRAIVSSHIFLKEFKKEFHLIASCTVRDNRFHCFEDNQSVTVNGVLCSECNFGCAAKQVNYNKISELMSASKVFRQKALNDFDKILVTSEYLKANLMDFVSAAKITLISNASDDVENVKKIITGISERLGFNLLIVGMLNENKGQIQLIKKIGKFMNFNKDIRLHFAGRGDRIQKRMIEIATEQGFVDRIEFHGFLNREELYKLYRECQVVLLPTLWPEPFGRVPLEAGLVRRPVISFAVGGLKETIIDGVTGILIPHLKYDLMFEKIKYLKENPDLRYSMGVSAFSHVVKNFSVKVHADNMRRAWL